MTDFPYLFIDGAYLQQVLLDYRTRWFPTAQIELNYYLVGRGYSKVFYYDCLPARKENESDADFDARSAPQKALFAHLRSIDGWHVNEGIAHHRKKRGQTQKEVDILIAVDMLTHAHRKNAKEMTFLAGDQDFCPLVEAVVRDGIYLTLMFDPLHTSRDLQNVADAGLKLDLYTLHPVLTTACRQANPLPAISLGGPIPSAAIQRAYGMRNGQLVAILRETEHGDWLISSTQTDANGHAHHMTYFNADFLKRAYADKYGALDWEPAL
ncbi:MAG: NYN domain-containing protein [Ramlibacter sp.]|nr:NYN domain-containing protein [Ramlibacter sp.]